jgi:hypothetical protein
VPGVCCAWAPRPPGDRRAARGHGRLLGRAEVGAARLQNADVVVDLVHVAPVAQDQDGLLAFGVGVGHARDAHGVALHVEIQVLDRDAVLLQFCAQFGLVRPAAAGHGVAKLLARLFSETEQSHRVLRGGE